MVMIKNIKRLFYIALRKVAELYGNAKDAKALAMEENTKSMEEYLTNIIQQLVRLPVL